jgi:hypothetical protein
MSKRQCIRLTISLLLPLAATAGFSEESAFDLNEAMSHVTTAVDNLLDHGRDTYGPVETPMIMSIIDIESESSPQHPEVLDGMIRSEGRLHRRNPGGADLWDDQPLLRTLYALSGITQDDRYTAAANDYVSSYFKRAPKENGLLAWGSHIFYDAYTDAPGGDQDGKGPHETLVLCPNWEEMYAVAPDAVTKQIEKMWEWHIVDKESGLHNRHDDKQPGCDFAFSGGEFAYAFAFLHSKTKDPQHLEWAKIAAGRHWNMRNTETNLAPDAPSTGKRYDAHHCFTTITGPHAALLLKCYEASGDEWFRDVAVAYLKAYLKHGWDEDADKWWGMLRLNGRPVRLEGSGDGYDAWKPSGYVDIWRSVMFSYEFPLIAAQTTLYAYDLTQDPAMLESARNWARHILSEMPPGNGRRWGDDIANVLPRATETGGTYAENYGRAISFFLHLHHVTQEATSLETAHALAAEAIDKLYVDGWFRGHPAKDYYESTDGVGYLLYALLELGAYPERLRVNL